MIHLARRILPSTTCTNASVADPPPVGENSAHILTRAGSVQSHGFEGDASSLFDQGLFSFELEPPVSGNPYMIIMFMSNTESLPGGFEGPYIVRPRYDNVQEPLPSALPDPWGGNAGM